jgi:fructose-bisphosphate aldolase, class II
MLHDPFRTTGKGLDNTNYHAAIAGAVSGAFHVRTMAEQYGVPVILHTDHCCKSCIVETL